MSDEGSVIESLQSAFQSRFADAGGRGDYVVLAELLRLPDEIFCESPDDETFIDTSDVPIRPKKRTRQQAKQQQQQSIQTPCELNIQMWRAFSREKGEKWTDDGMETSAHSSSRDTDIWSGIGRQHVKVLWMLSSKDEKMSQAHAAAIAEQTALIGAVLRVFSSAAMLPVLYCASGDGWRLARHSGSVELQEEAARVTNRCFTACINERTALSAQSRRWGAYRTASLLLRIYFSLGQLNLVQNVLKALQACELPPLTQFPAAHSVTYAYFLGRYHFVREEFDAAESFLTLALARLLSSDPRRFPAHTALVLHFLIPCQLVLHGRHPTHRLLQFVSERNRVFYERLLDAMGRGDLAAFHALLQQNAHVLLTRGVFTIYERLSYLVIRQRLRRIHRATEATRIPLSVVAHALIPHDADEVACWLANLIARGLVKGYLSEERAFLVLSQKDPFPPLSKGCFV